MMRQIQDGESSLRRPDLSDMMVRRCMTSSAARTAAYRSEDLDCDVVERTADNVYASQRASR
jgi:hypothetical protein